MATEFSKKILEARIVELETKLSFQEDLVQELNARIITQQSQIDKLEALSSHLKEQ